MASSAPTLRYSRVTHRSRAGVRLTGWLVSWLLALLLGGLVVGWRYEEMYRGRVFEGVAVNGVALGGMTPEQAETALRLYLAPSADARVILKVEEESWVANAADLGIHVDTDKIVEEALRLGREGSIVEQWAERFLLWYGSENRGAVAPQYARNPRAVDALLTRIANEVARDPVDAALTIQGLSISATPAVPGRQLDWDASRERLLQALETNEGSVELVVSERAPTIIGAEEAAEKARALLEEPVTFFFDQPEYEEDGASVVPVAQRRQWLVDRSQLAAMLSVFSTPTDVGQYAYDVRLKPELLRPELEKIANAIAREPRDARFDYDPNSGTLTPIVISQEGLSLDVEEALAAVEQTIAEGRHEVELPVARIAPRVATSDADKLQITGVAVEGTSDYTGSADEREVNLSVAANQYHGLVIPPGAEFSFNEHLGWVVDANGYEEGYIISGNRTQVDVGGGVCQVSTTIFRAAFYAGFDITERHAHAYRVPYYENGSPMGFDATVFSPIVDFKFRNNTENWYLMEVENDREANTLAVKLYGPPTGREVEAITTVVSEEEPGPPVYEDDPALPAGVTKQVDWEHPGATVKLERVIRDSNGVEVGRDEFWSEFRPWRAHYLVGTGE